MTEHFDEIPSTSAHIKANLGRYRHGDVVTTSFQTAGYGQRGNHWESERDANALFSLMLEPTRIAPADGFMLTEIVTLGILDALDVRDIRIKWPNDIYVNNHKLAGILVEATMNANAFMTAVVGIGLNLNQTRFLSDAPNPISLKQITGQRYDVDSVIRDVCNAIMKRYDAEIDYETLHQEYLSHLYRFNEFHDYQLPAGEVFEAKIIDVDKTGLLIVETPDGIRSSFEFKTIKYII